MYLEDFYETPEVLQTVKMINYSKSICPIPQLVISTVDMKTKQRFMQFFAKVTSLLTWSMSWSLYDVLFI